ncbi:MAG: hypothetical protein ABMA13_18920 [Chthoniobacteraceae bacterium]
MTPAQIQSLADGVASILLSHAAHGLATSALEGMGEITLRDGLIVAAAAVGAHTKQAWILDREVLPAGWTDAAVDLVIFRHGNQNNTKEVGGIELKWWRQTDPGNAANRRRDLIRDFIRAAALYSLVEDFAFVSLLSTAGSWSATATTSGSDRAAMTKLGAAGSQTWNIPNMISSSAIKGAVKSLSGKVPITNIFHTELLASFSLNNASGLNAFAKVWLVKKPQNTQFLQPAEIALLIQ